MPLDMRHRMQSFFGFGKNHTTNKEPRGNCDHSVAIQAAPSTSMFGSLVPNSGLFSRADVGYIKAYNAGHIIWGLSERVICIGCVGVQEFSSPVAGFLSYQGLQRSSLYSSQRLRRDLLLAALQGELRAWSVIALRDCSRRSANGLT